MIKVEELTKRYGPAEALRGISFEVAKGEVIGFLGPNGAGKSTTMKILAGYLLPTSGRATIDGLDVVADSLEIRRRIGYLPESTPLYTEMRVDEYLRFAAGLHGVPRERMPAALDRVFELCSLQRVTGRKILELSKGYKQRVGLAQAMIHEPDLLLLDEPTSGLDPNQIVDVRELVMELGEQHTVVLSTHYLQEVEASCSRIVIINLGEIVADDHRDALIAEMPPGPVRARIQGPAENVLAQIGELLPRCEAEVLDREGDYAVYRLHGTGNGPLVEEGIAELVLKNGWSMSELVRERPTLEDAFRALTGAKRTGAQLAGEKGREGAHA
jgi:ABC-2 type transport system ATP-binding protein